MAKDYYETLGISRSANPDEIKQAYKKLAKKHHPDLNKGSADAEAKFMEVNEAYRVLGDEKRKAQYDRFGHDEQTQSQGGQAGQSGFHGAEGFGGFDFNDIFGEFFGGQGFGRSRPARGEDIEIEVHLTLEEASQGKQEKLRIDRLRPCVACKGSGAEGGKRVQCNACRGQGQVRKTQRTPFGIFQTVVSCDTCNGMRTIPEKPCKECKGAGRQEKEDSLTVEIPPGVADRMQLRVRGEGHAGIPGQPAGDLLVDVYVEEHELFTREGDDLHIQASITYPQAVLGTALEVPTLQGSIKLAIPEGTQSHTVFRAKGKGMPTLRGGRGDLLVTVHLQVPKSPSKQERELLEKLSQTEKPRSFFERFKL